MHVESQAYRIRMLCCETFCEFCVALAAVQGSSEVRIEFCAGKSSTNKTENGQTIFLFSRSGARHFPTNDRKMGRITSQKEAEATASCLHLKKSKERM